MASVVARSNQGNALRLGQESTKLIQDYLRHVLEFHKKTKTDFVNKLTNIDIAYARYKVQAQNATPLSQGVDAIAANTLTGITEKEITVPIVISQVDSFVGYLSEVFLSGYPLFPVVSEPNDQKEAEQLESIIDTHSLIGSYPRHLLMAFRDGIKYNFMPIEQSWEPVEHYDIVADHLNTTQAAQLKANTSHFTRVRRLDPYNTVWDSRLDPAEVSADGEFAGFIDIVPRIPLKRFVNMYSKSGKLYNISEIGGASRAGPSVGDNFYYTELPTISNSMQSQRKATDSFDWAAWLGAEPQRANRRTLHSGIYERFTCYARIIPSEFKANNVPQQNSPQIWKFVLIDGKHLLYACRVYGVYDTLPILIGQPLEDGFGLQTQSIGESQIVMQEAASTLINIKFNSSRRAVSDRALYDPTLINASDVNSVEPAAKIAVRLSGLNDKDFDRAYKQIPYDPSGTDGLIGDVRNLTDLSDRLSGLNKPFQGQFQKGNKSVQEWTDTMNFGDNRPRLPALNIEFQTMIPLKENIKRNIFQHGVLGTFQNFRTGELYKLTAESVEKMKSKVLSFRIADGYTPKSKLASTEFIGKLLETVAQIPQLAATWGLGLPKMFSHLAQLGGVRGLEQYLPQQPALGAPADGTGTTAAPVAAPPPA